MWMMLGSLISSLGLVNLNREHIMSTIGYTSCRYQNVIISSFSITVLINKNKTHTDCNTNNDHNFPYVINTLILYINSEFFSRSEKEGIIPYKCFLY